MDPALPADVDGAKTLLRELAPLPPANPHQDSGPWDFLKRVESGRQERFVRPLLHDLLVDPSPIVRLRALEILMVLPTSSATLDQIIEVARSSHELFRHVSTDGGRLDHALEHALANEAVASRRGPEITQAFHQLVGSGLPNESGVVGHFDIDWSMDIARRFAASESDGRYWSRLAEAVAWFHRDQLLDLLALLRPLPAPAKEAVVAGVGEWLGKNEQRLREMCAEDGFPPPAKPAPSLAECRSAIELPA